MSFHFLSFSFEYLLEVNYCTSRIKDGKNVPPAYHFALKHIEDLMRDEKRTQEAVAKEDSRVTEKETLSCVCE